MKIPPDQRLTRKEMAKLVGVNPDKIVRLIPEASMTLLLIPVADALPAVQAHLERWPDDELPSPAELAELVALTARYVRASEALLAYAEAVGGRPVRN